MPSTFDALSQAVNRAGDRTAGLLWRPFDAKTWLVLAYAQFLAALPPDFWGGGGNLGDGGLTRAGEEIESTWERIVAGGFILGLVIVALFVILVLAVVLTWVASRAKFVFLDDLLNRRAQIVEPWKRFSREGNSLFFCTIALFVAGAAVVATAAITVFATFRVGGIRDVVSNVVPFVVAGTLAAFVGVCFGYVAFYLQAFVVPLMHRYRIGAVDAWRRFFGIWSANPFPFMVVGLVVIVGFVAFATLAIVFGLMTCCVGFLFLMAPYLSNVLLLPATVFYRAFTVEFLAQFDRDLLAPAPQPAQ